MATWHGYALDRVKLAAVVEGDVLAWHRKRATVLSISRTVGRWAEPGEQPMGAPRRRRASDSRELAQAGGWELGWAFNGQAFDWCDVELATADGPVRLFLPDWVMPSRVPEHYPVCGCCGGMWPCESHEFDRELDRMRYEAAAACWHCGKPVASCVTVAGRRYHAAKSHRKCRTAAEAAAEADCMRIEWLPGGGARVLPKDAPSRHDPGCTGVPPTAGCGECINLARGYR